MSGNVLDRTKRDHEQYFGEEGDAGDVGEYLGDDGDIWTGAREECQSVWDETASITHKLNIDGEGWSRNVMLVTLNYKIRHMTDLGSLRKF